MKKMKRFLVAMLGGLTAIACLAGVSACKKESEVEATKPSYDINLNIPDNLVDTKTCVHDYSIVYAEEAATCTSEGSKVLGCSKCGDDITVSTGLGHNYGDAKCTAPAKCTICGEAKDLVKAAHNMVAATCTADAYCADCDYVEADTALGHTEGEFTCVDGSSCTVCNAQIKAAHNIVSAFGTLVKDGTMNTYPDLKARVKADELGIQYVDSDCDELGYKAFSYCADCYGEFVTERAKDGQVALDWTLFQNAMTAAKLNANQKREAEMEYIFGENGVVYADGYETIATKHTMVNFFSGDAKNEAGEYILPTCTLNGLKQFQVCLGCTTVNVASLTTEAAIAKVVKVATGATAPELYSEGYDEAVVAPLGHTSIDPTTGVDNFKAGIPATCTQPGKQWTASCVRCNLQLNEVVRAGKTTIDPLGHDVAGQVQNCESAVNCINCNAQVYAKRTHSFVTAGVANKAATCFESGYENVKVCSYANCDAISFKEVAMKAHNWVAYKEADSAATVTCAKGFVRANIYKCATCAASGVETYAELSDKVYNVTTWLYEVEPSTIHTKATGYAEATCLKAAQNTKCSVCNEDVFAAPANGHNYGVVPTCTTEGTCNNANCDNAGKIAKLNHNNDKAWVAYETKLPTCAEPGYLAYDQCSLCNVIRKGSDKKLEYKVGVDAEGKDVFVAHSIEIGGSLYLAPVAHQFAKVAAKAASCKEAGWNEHKACVNCGLVEGREDYAKKECASTQASCAATVKCDTCDNMIPTTNVIPCQGHNADGCCKVCDKFLGHSYVNGQCVCGVKEQPVA